MLPEAVADRLKNDIPAESAPFLESTSALCRRYGVSRPTMRKALSILSAEGVLRMRRYGRAAVVGRKAAETLRATSSEKFAAKLKGEIRQGVFLSGTPLPKIAFFTLRDGVSSHTVHRALRTLCAEQIVHSRGRTYIVGSRPIRVEAGQPFPTILILTPRPKAWSKLLGNNRVQQFGLTFILEAQRCGIRLMELPLPRHENQFADWRRATLEPHLDSCIGLLVEGVESEGVSIKALLPALSTLRLPLVWFDKNGTGNNVKIPWNWVFRCCTSDELVARTALEYLAEWGHRSIAFVHTGARPWEQERGNMLHTAWKALDSENRICIETVHEIADWQNGTLRLRQALERLHTLGPIPSRRAIDFLIENRNKILREFPTPSAIARSDPYAPAFALCRAHFDKALPGSATKRWRESLGHIWSGLAIHPCLDSQATALIAPNDDMALTRHSYWLRDTGLHCPQDMSLISFDNKYWSSFHPLTTVDFGFGHLGYQAFHAILGDTSVDRDRRGRIVARPNIIDGGTVRKPARR